MKRLIEYLDKKLELHRKEAGASFVIYNELIALKLLINQSIKDDFQLIAFDLEDKVGDEPGEEHLILSFRAKPEQIKDIIKSRRYVLGGNYSILGKDER